MATAAPEAPVITPEEQTILNQLRQKPEGATPSELARAVVSIGDSAIREAIWRLMAAGRVKLSSDLKVVLR